MIQIQQFTFNPFQENTYLLYDETGECVIIDPGCYEHHEKEELKNFITSQGLKVVKLLNTHCHVDHVLGNNFVKNEYNVGLEMHEKDVPTLESVKVYAPSYGFVQYEPVEPDTFLDEGDQVKFGNSILDIVFVPGHAPGHIAFYNKEQNICIGGDVLFQMSVGRTDLPGGNHETLISSIHEKIFPLGDDMVVYPGHGPETNIGFEKQNNPFCAVAQ